MKPFNELTRLGKLRRLHNLVITVLEEYDLNVKWVKFMMVETNTMFKVQSFEGENYVLRIYSDEETTLTENQTEIFWLQALLRETEIKVSEPVARKDGDFITVADVPGVPGEKRCVLFRWVPGRVLEKHLDAANYFKLGQVMARLHDHADTLRPLPSSIRPKRWDRVFYYPDEPVVYNTAPYQYLFPPDCISIIEQVISLADDEFARLYADQERQIIIHGDLHYWNVHLHRGQLYVLDFEDVMLGYPVQDVAVTLYYGRDRDEYPQLYAAFKDGYTSLRAWPVERIGQLDTLMAARSVNFINYVARVDPSPDEFIQEKCSELKDYLDFFG
jgi:Ser/Thr protein kinase RdoA (MazF antagonist)